MMLARGRRIAGAAVFFLFLIPSCATYRESMDTMRKTFPGRQSADMESGKPMSTDNAARKP